MNTAVTLHQKGQLAEARQHYAQVIGLTPRNFDALQLMGLCCLQAGDLTAARQFLDRALALRQDVASVFNHRGIAMRRLGDPQAALADFGRAIALGLRSGDAHYNRANTLRDLGRFSEALDDYREAAARQPGRPDFLNNLGGCLVELALHEEALTSYDRLIAIDPRYPDAHSNRGLVLQKLGRLDEALASVDRALALAPGLASAWSNKGGILIAFSRYREALGCLDRAMELAPATADTLLQRGLALAELGRGAEAEQNLEAALSLKPGLTKAKVELARLAADQGRFVEAESLFRQVLQVEPRNVMCLYGLSGVRKYAAGDPLFAAIEGRLGDDGLTADEQVMLTHGYAKICNDVGRDDDAMAYYARSKSLRTSRFDLARQLAAYDAMRRLFTSDFFSARRSLGSEDPRPVFIVGMPRSGTTLTEQILSAHPEVQGLGELQDMPRVSRELGGGLDDVERFTAACLSLDAARAESLAASYAKAYEGCDPSKRRLLDKRPHNFELLGLVALLFPGARIIHCQRGAMDTCLSMYMQDFAEGHGYNGDLATLGHYYRGYEELMAHWQAVLPLPIHSCVYEDTVADVETSARALVAFLGLDWNPACLEYHARQNQVRTPSQWQVRQPVYRSSVERWRRYEAHLGPLKQALGLA